MAPIKHGRQFMYGTGPGPGPANPSPSPQRTRSLVTDNRGVVVSVPAVRKAREPKKARKDLLIESMAINLYRELGDRVSINMLDLPEIFEKAYQAGVGAKYLGADPDTIRGAMADQMRKDIQRLKRDI
jgi:hypothetical protein